MQPGAWAVGDSVPERDPKSCSPSKRPLCWARLALYGLGRQAVVCRILLLVETRAEQCPSHPHL